MSPTVVRQRERDRHDHRCRGQDDHRRRQQAARAGGGRSGRQDQGLRDAVPRAVRRRRAHDRPEGRPRRRPRRPRHRDRRRQRHGHQDDQARRQGHRLQVQRLDARQDRVRRQQPGDLDRHAGVPEQSRKHRRARQPRVRAEHGVFAERPGQVQRQRAGLRVGHRHRCRSGSRRRDLQHEQGHQPRGGRQEAVPDQPGRRGVQARRSVRGLRALARQRPPGAHGARRERQADDQRAAKRRPIRAT